MNEDFLKAMEKVDAPGSSRKTGIEWSAWADVGIGIGSVQGIRKLELYPPALRLSPPSRPPRSESARRKWAFILQRAEVVGLETAYQEWKSSRDRLTRSTLAKAIGGMIRDKIRSPSFTEQIFPTARPTLLSERDYKALVAETDKLMEK